MSVVPADFRQPRFPAADIRGVGPRRYFTRWWQPRRTRVAHLHGIEAATAVCAVLHDAGLDAHLGGLDATGAHAVTVPAAQASPARRVLNGR